MLSLILRSLTSIFFLLAVTAKADTIVADIDGSGNDLTIIQAGVGSKVTEVYMSGDNNVANINQKDTGGHEVYLDISGDDHSATILQEGNGDHTAIVILGGSQAWNFDLTQTGSTSQSYNSSATCNAFGGCNLTVTQQ